MTINNLSIIKPDDWHCHLRDDTLLSRTVPDIAKRFARALVMPNLMSPITTVDKALAYKKRIEAHVPPHLNFVPHMTLYLTEALNPEEIERAKTSGAVLACKLYPKHATTQSEFGVGDIKKIYPMLEAMQKHQLVLCIHGEALGADIDIFDRERKFIEDTLTQLIKDFPQLKIVLEHISTRDAVDFILSQKENVAATITVHHLLIDRNDLLAGGIKPHYYCMPIVKQKADKLALIQAATSGNPKFFLGTDSAPHAIHSKENPCGCAGIYTAHAAIELYAEVFAQALALDKLEAFASIYGAQFYGLPRNSEKITLRQGDWEVPAALNFGESQVVPFRAEQKIHWVLAD